ncbi:MAG: ATP-dependent DNA helicase [Moraxellaceae bacterium]|jgi:ATP-dependent DNA helicase DinG|nr:ATP-dependent DNA helicase [Moraxellaceae bacterium]MBP7229221.1 ATP-dependent DNA helicase [Moraxellaceae bacterium]MBP8851891.1 ATP-dependent DNA helicase [Moraxellaceae bacterium]MBP9045020.1 ATP-dependent DNA helicase [Moraxellaceae bacterium]MBP9730051.1 ATP-dependent DNA helicase [Moraxellaceae bacterium]
MTERFDSRAILGEQGRLAAHIPGFRSREPQLLMSDAVGAAIREKRILMVEAGTGTGKTYAYLAPALLSGEKVIVSTGTRNLQDQLYHRDLPTILAGLGVSVQTALLKGRANYLCPYRLNVHLEDGRFASKQTVHELQRVAEWAHTTKSGDIAELSDLPEDASVWPLVTSTADNCLGQECPMIEECPLARARKKASEADLVVVNHHLFFADVAIKEEGFGELLPEATAIIFDEAHQLPEVASMFFGESISSRQLLELAQDSVGEMLMSAGEMRSILDASTQLENRVADMRLVFGDESRKGIWTEVSSLEKMPDAIKEVRLAMAHLSACLNAASARSKGLESTHRRAEDLLLQFEKLTGDTPENQVHWFETFKKGFVLQWTPLDVAKPFRDMVAGRKSSWIFTSATLAVHEDFKHFSSQLGLSDLDSMQLPSPFAYEKQALFYVPRGLPDTSDPRYTQAVLEASLPVLQASRGRAFVLFTSHRALKEAAEWYRGRLEYPLFVQGTMAKAELLKRFREHGNGVLLGTGSFWEGVDVRGEALSCVIIDKLPFASPGDPVVSARIDAYKARGRNAFMSYQLPGAIIAMKQGSGRLIRDETDTGVLMVCDPRLVGRPYGQLFLQSLPPMRRTRALDEVREFFALIDSMSESPE